MRTETEFTTTYNYFMEEYSSKLPLLIKGGKNGYLLTDIDEENVTILQRKTSQKHKVHCLNELFTKGTFTGPRNGVIYNRDTKWGHLGMKNAIVDFLIKLFEQMKITGKVKKTFNKTI
jgi:hypothetical protein